MRRIQPLRPRWVVTGAIVFAALIWSASFYSIATRSAAPSLASSTSQIGSSAASPPGLYRWQAGLRPWDRVVAVNGQHWREMRRLVREAGIGGTVVYTVERGDQRLQIAVPTMEFTFDILLRLIPGGLFLALLCLTTGISVYVRNSAGWLSRYLLLPRPQKPCWWVRFAGSEER